MLVTAGGSLSLGEVRRGMKDAGGSRQQSGDRPPGWAATSELRLGCCSPWGVDGCRAWSKPEISLRVAAHRN